LLFVSIAAIAGGEYRLLIQARFCGESQVGKACGEVPVYSVSSSIKKMTLKLQSLILRLFLLVQELKIFCSHRFVLRIPSCLTFSRSSFLVLLLSKWFMAREIWDVIADDTAAPTWCEGSRWSTTV
jgi:hypothetical protein